MAYEFSRVPGSLRVGLLDIGSLTYIQLDSAWVYETSGDAWFVRFPCVKAQTNAALQLQVHYSANNGSPTFAAELRDAAGAGEDPDRPDVGGAALATSADLALGGGDDDTWVTFTFASASLVMGQSYYLIIYNKSGDPTSAYGSFAYRGAVDALGNATPVPVNCGYTANGFTADPVVSVGDGAAVIKFSDGSLLGMPYVDSEAHASDQNDRGVRLAFAEDVVVSSLFLLLSTSSWTGVEVNKAADGTTVASASLDNYNLNRARYLRYTPITLAGGSSYDFVAVLSGSSTAGTIYNMGEAEGSLPADVLACRPYGWGHVTGSQDPSGTPYTVDTSKIMQFAVDIDDNPAQAGGGGSGRIIGG